MNVQSKPAQVAAQASVVARPQGARASSPAGAATGVAGPPRQSTPPQSTPPQGSTAPRGNDEGVSSADMVLNLDRLDAYSSSIAERVRSAFEQTAPGEQEALRDAMEMIQGGLDRVRSGIQNGTLTSEDIQRGTSKLYEMVSERIAEVDPSVIAADASGAGSVEDGKGGEMSELGSSGDGPGLGGPNSASGVAAAAPEAGNPLSPQSALLNELSGLGAQLQALLGESLFGGQGGQIYGLGNLPETITPRSSGLDLSA